MKKDIKACRLNKNTSQGVYNRTARSCIYKPIVKSGIISKENYLTIGLQVCPAIKYSLNSVCFYNRNIRITASLQHTLGERSICSCRRGEGVDIIAPEAGGTGIGIEGELLAVGVVEEAGAIRDRQCVSLLLEVSNRAVGEVPPRGAPIGMKYTYEILYTPDKGTAKGDNFSVEGQEAYYGLRFV